jgi:hypothetical protein
MDSHLQAKLSGLSWQDLMVSKAGGFEKSVVILLRNENQSGIFR